MWQIFGMEEVAAKIMINRNDAGLLLHSWQDRGRRAMMVKSFILILCVNSTECNVINGIYLCIVPLQALLLVMVYPAQKPFTKGHQF